MTLRQRKPLVRRAPLKARQVAKKQGTSLPAPRRPIPKQSAKVKADQPRRRAVKVECQERDGGCVLRDRGDCFGNPSTFQHVVKAGQGGAYSVENGAILCEGHNQWVETHRSEATALGVHRNGLGPIAKAQLLYDRRRDSSS